MEANITRMNEMRVAFVRHVGPYNEVGAAWGQLCAWAGRRGLVGPQTMMFGLCGLWKKRGASAERERGGKARAGEGYGDALLSEWVPLPEDSVPAPQPARSEAQEQPDDAVLERFYRNQG